MSLNTTVEVTENVWTVLVEPEGGEAVTVETPSTALIEIFDEAAQGLSGASAYQIAVANGFIGTEAQWLASLQAGGVIGAVDAYYVHNQVTPSIVWTVNHNLGKYPAIDVTDSAGSRGMGTVHDTSINQSIITFSAAMGGFAFCN
jgi:hypothetical protein